MEVSGVAQERQVMRAAPEGLVVVLEGVEAKVPKARGDGRSY